MFLMVILAIQPALAFEELTEAQSRIYNHDHLSNTEQGQILNYRFVGEATGDEKPQPIEDQASVSVLAMFKDGTRDVDVDFLSDERRIALPTFSGYRGNPIIIAMLEHIAQSMSAKSGGGTLYFRNRIRDALASEDVRLEKQKTSYQNKEIAATVLSIYPFLEDQHLAADEVLRQARINIRLSDDVPGGVLGVSVSARKDGELFARSLTLM